MNQPIRESEILFPHQSNTPSLSTTLATLRRSTLSLHNRLSSITSDSSFVTCVASAYHLPLIANERCGSWYIPPSQKAGSVYFKSTDGHMGQWKFSLRRLNLHLLDVVAERGGVVVVDSTRRGKSMPDALSKTVPVWCAVVNRAVFGENGEDREKGRLYVPPSVVGESERVQMEGRMEGFVKQFVEVCKPHILTLRAKLTKPLRPIWITTASSLPPTPPSFADFYPIVLCTASRRVQGAEMSDNGYIQGAADDHEAWSLGLTPQLFWKHKDLLMSTCEDDAPSVIEKLVAEDEGVIATTTLIHPTTNLYISSSENIDPTNFDAVIACTPTTLLFSDSKENGPKHNLHLKCQTGKLGSRNLRTQLPLVPHFLASLPSLSSSKILVCCTTGKDVAVGTALAVLCLAADEQGTMDGQLRAAEAMTKAMIKQRLSWITTSNPTLNPSRATLQSVNAVLFEPRTRHPIPSSPTKLHTDTCSNPNPSRSSTVTHAIDCPPLLPSPPSPAAFKPPNPPPPISLQERIFASLHACKPWSFTRTLCSTLPTQPSGRVTGTATFTPCGTRTPTLLYAEEGELILDSGLRFGVGRRYVWVLRGGDEAVGTATTAAATATATATAATTATATTAPAPVTPSPQHEKHIAIHFFDDDAQTAVSERMHGEPMDPNGQGIGALFVEMDTVHPPSPSPSPSSSPSSTKHALYKAANKHHHLCAEDVYTARWRFSPGMVAERAEGAEDAEVWWEVGYEVSGPRKAYTSWTRYTRA